MICVIHPLHSALLWSEWALDNGPYACSWRLRYGGSDAEMNRQAAYELGSCCASRPRRRRACDSSLLLCELQVPPRLPPRCASAPRSRSPARREPRPLAGTRMVQGRVPGSSRDCLATRVRRAGVPGMPIAEVAPNGQSPMAGLDAAAPGLCLTSIAGVSCYCVRRGSPDGPLAASGQGRGGAP
jgi:hypothetical protein